MHGDFLARSRSSSVKVDDIAHFLAAAIDNPVVAIERARVALEPHAVAGFGAQFAVVAREGLEFGRGAAVAVQLFPAQNVLPHLLVDGVVDHHHCAHVFFRG